MLSLNLTHTAEYALRAMTTLALKPESDPMNSRELASRTGIPVHYLNKIMHHMVEAGLADSAKGHGGGFQLGKSPSRISYLDILKVAGYETEVSRCVFGHDSCRSDRPCPMHNAWGQLNENFVAWARRTTLASLKKPKES